jgi:transposase
MSRRRKTYSPEFKSRIALEALENDLTIQEIAAKYGVHPTMVTRWRKELLMGASSIFSSKNKKKTLEKEHEAEIKELHAKIGQLTVERDFLAKACGR